MRRRISRIVMDYVPYFILAYKQYMACNLEKRGWRVEVPSGAINRSRYHLTQISHLKKLHFKILI